MKVTERKHCAMFFGLLYYQMFNASVYDLLKMFLVERAPDLTDCRV